MQGVYLLRRELSAMSFEMRYVPHLSYNPVLLLSWHKAQDVLERLNILTEHQTVGKTQSAIN